MRKVRRVWLNRYYERDLYGSFEKENTLTQRKRWFNNTTDSNELFSQATEKLGALSNRADQAKRDLASDVEQANAFMKVYEGDEWNGSRVKVEASVEQIEQRVRCCTLGIVVVVIVLPTPCTTPCILHPSQSCINHGFGDNFELCKASVLSPQQHRFVHDGISRRCLVVAAPAAHRSCGCRCLLPLPLLLLHIRGYLLPVWFMLE